MDDYGPYSTAEAKDSHGFYVNMTGAVSDVPPAPKLFEPVDASDRALDRQVGGDHYKHFKIQPVEFIESNQLGFSVGNCVKYCCRYVAKGNRMDLEKAIDYLQKKLEMDFGS